MPRTVWPAEVIDAILKGVAWEALEYVLAQTPGAMSKPTFYKLLTNDPMLQQRYRDAVREKVMRRVYHTR
ncbi:hypothetical protein [Paraburkholderia terrae]|uniref:hypothetical protein n=1 Tax=Paraburkholderia terrae TaxID=311230 RepID=UPI001EE2472A|nr:hypothetical protein [Paraburkholderia terrae]GJH02281.1 hypothetical protein CBA19C8_17010 [Paraburkholderia terrae]